MKVRPRNLTKKQTIETLDALYTAAGSLKGREAMKRFLRDLLTPSERVMLGRRILIARRLLAEMSHREIAEDLGVGNDTVWKVHRWLLDSMPGYEDALDGMEREFKKRAFRAEVAYGPYSFRALKQKYPLHFLLFSLADGLSRKSKKKNYQEGQH